jgi:hypothetical protein
MCKRRQKGPNRHQADCLGYLNMTDFNLVYDLMRSSEAMAFAAQTISKEPTALPCLFQMFMR